MTLATSILIRRPVAVEAVREFCNRELLHVEDPPLMDSDYFARFRPQLRRIDNMPGLGLTAILDVTYNPDGPIAADYLGDEGEGFGLDTGSMVVGFDTAYGFGRGKGYGCRDLHAYFILRLAEEFGPVTWQNGYTGDWHRLDDPTLGSPDFGPLLQFGSPTAGRMAVEDARSQAA